MMEPSEEFDELTDENLPTFLNRWEKSDRLLITRCVKDITLAHVKHLVSSMRTLKFSHLNTFKNLRTLLTALPELSTLLFYDACFDQYTLNTGKMIFHKNITHIVLTSSTTLATKEHWIMEFLYEEVEFENLLSLRIQKFYPAQVIKGEVEEVIKRYMKQMDENLVTKLILKNRHNLKELELGGQGLRMTLEDSASDGTSGKSMENTSCQYDSVPTVSTGLQHQEVKISSTTQYDREFEAQTGLKTTKRAANKEITYVFDAKGGGLRDILPPQTMRMRYSTSRHDGIASSSTRDSGNSTETPSLQLYYKAHPDEDPESHNRGLKDQQKQKKVENPTENEVQKPKRKPIEKLKKLHLDSFMFSFDAPRPALEHIFKSQKELKTLVCTHVFVLHDIVITASALKLRSLTENILTCIRNNASSLVEVTLDPIMVADISRNVLSKFDYLDNFEINCHIFSECTSLRVLRLGLHAFRRVQELGVPVMATVMGTKVTALDQIPAFQLAELSLSLEEYSRDDFERFANLFGTFLNIRVLYLGTSTLVPENTFLVRTDYLRKLLYLPKIKSIVFHNAKLENPEEVKDLVDSFPNGVTIFLTFEFQRFTFEFERNRNKINK